jgi:hypothetical protein
MFIDHKNQKSLGFTYFLLLFSALCLSPSAFATITVNSGGGQQIAAGSDSQDIVFKVLDDQGNPNTGTTINFTLIGPQGNTITDGLSNNTATPDGNDGLVSTRLNSTGTIGNYAITARQATDSTQSATTNVIVIAGNAAKLTVSAGDNQTITQGQVSSNLTFQLTDTFNNAVAGEDINFTVRTPTGETSSSGLSSSTATTDSNGEVTTRLENSDTKGNYTVIATRAADTTMTANVLIIVTDARPDLPSLGLGMTLEANGAITDANAIFNGGTKVNDGEFQQEVVLTTNDSVLIQSEITIDSAHVGQAADILVVAYYNPIAAFDTGGEYVMIDNRNAVLPWNGDPASLVSFISVNQLPAKQFVNMYGGTLPAGQVRAYVGYRLINSGLVIFNGNQTINARIR